MTLLSIILSIIFGYLLLKFGFSILGALFSFVARNFIWVIIIVIILLILF